MNKKIIPSIILLFMIVALLFNNIESPTGNIITKFELSNGTEITSTLFFGNQTLLPLDTVLKISFNNETRTIGLNDTEIDTGYGELFYEHRYGIYEEGFGIEGIKEIFVNVSFEVVINNETIKGVVSKNNPFYINYTGINNTNISISYNNTNISVIEINDSFLILTDYSEFESGYGNYYEGKLVTFDFVFNFKTPESGVYEIVTLLESSLFTKTFVKNITITNEYNDQDNEESSDNLKVLFEAEDITYSNWIEIDNPIYSDSKAIMSNTNGSRLEFDFSGSDLFILTQKRFDFGIIKINVDGISKQIDLYSSQSEYNQIIEIISSLGDNIHHVEVIVTGNKNLESIGTYCLVDSFLTSGEINNGTIIIPINDTDDVIINDSIGINNSINITLDDADINLSTNVSINLSLNASINSSLNISVDLGNATSNLIIESENVVKIFASKINYKTYAEEIINYTGSFCTSVNRFNQGDSSASIEFNETINRVCFDAILWKNTPVVNYIIVNNQSIEFSVNNYGINCMDVSETKNIRIIGQDVNGDIGPFVCYNEVYGTNE